MIEDLAVGDVVRMRRVHPCGGWEWRVTRVGADVGLSCLTCSRAVMLDRQKFDSRVKTRVSAGA